MNQRRVMFLSLCFFGYVMLMAGWWISTRGNARLLPPVKLRLVPFTGAEDPFSSELEQSLKNVPGVELSSDGAVLSGDVQSKQTVNVTARLKNPLTGEVFWSKDYRATVNDPQPIPREVAHDAIEAVRKKLLK
jgi:hypothetical protein